MTAVRRTPIRPGCSEPVVRTSLTRPTIDWRPTDDGPTSRSARIQPSRRAAGHADRASTDVDGRRCRPVGRPLPRVIAVANQKGGVGKTTTTVNLGACLAELGQRTLIIDLDPQGNASTGLGIENRGLETSMYHVLMHEVPLENCIEPTDVKDLFVAPASLDLAGAEIELVPAFSRETRLRRAIEAVLDDYDYVLIDCPPSLGLLTVNGLSAAHEVLVPIQCEYYALEGLGQLLRNVDLVRRNLNPTLRGQHHRLRDVRRPDQARRSGRQRGARALRRQGAADGRPAVGPAVRGAVVRPADHHVRSPLAWRHRLPRRGQGGARWLGAAGWVRGSAR